MMIRLWCVTFDYVCKKEEEVKVENNAKDDASQQNNAQNEGEIKDNEASKDENAEQKQEEEKKEEDGIFTQEELSEVRAKFQKYDKDNNGTLDKNEYRLLLEDTLDRKISDNLFHRYLEIEFNLADVDKNGTIDFPEFCAVYKRIYTNPDIPIHFSYKQTEHKVVLETGKNAPKIIREKLGVLTEEQMIDCRNKFDFYDANKNGTIEKDELRNLLTDTLGKKMSTVMINRFCDSQFQLWDKDDSGTIEFD